MLHPLFAYSIGGLTIADSVVEPMLQAGWRIAVIVVISVVLVRFGKRLVDRGVRRVQEPDGSPFGRFRQRDGGPHT